MNPRNSTMIRITNVEYKTLFKSGESAVAGTVRIMRISNEQLNHVIVTEYFESFNASISIFLVRKAKTRPTM